MATFTSPARAADPMHVILRHIRKVEIHHMGELLNINAPGGDIGSHQDTHRAVLEALQGSGTGTLALVAVNRRSHEPLMTESFSHPVCTVFGA